MTVPFGTKTAASAFTVKLHSERLLATGIESGLSRPPESRAMRTKTEGGRDIRLIFIARETFAERSREEGPRAP